MEWAVGNQLLDLSLNWAPWYSAALARPAGFALIFAVFAWGNIQSGLLRMAFATVLALPVLGTDIGGRDFAELEIPYSLTLVKEVFIGVMLAFFASIPLAIAVGAGGFIDYYRGAFNGTADPAGGQISPVASLFAITSLWIFANLGGFWIVSAMIYSSYEVWPVQSQFPIFKGGADAFLKMVEVLARGALILAGPLVCILFISDIAHLISTKFGKQINVSHLAFSSKNLIVALLLPLFMIVVARSMQTDFEFYKQALDWMKVAFE